MFITGRSISLQCAVQQHSATVRCKALSCEEEVKGRLRIVAFLNTMVNLLPDMHAVERDSWQACCSRCVPTVLATPDAASPPPFHPGTYL